MAKQKIGIRWTPLAPIPVEHEDKVSVYKKLEIYREENEKLKRFVDVLNDRIQEILEEKEFLVDDNSRLLTDLAVLNRKLIKMQLAHSDLLDEMEK